MQDCVRFLLFYLFFFYLSVITVIRMGKAF